MWMNASLGLTLKNSYIVSIVFTDVDECQLGTDSCEELYCITLYLQM